MRLRLTRPISLMLCLAIRCAALPGSGNPNAGVVTVTPPATTGGDTTSDPITVMDGDVKIAELDLVVPCPLIDLVLQRNYNSLGADAAATSCTLGHGWTHSYAWYLTTMTVTNTIEYPPWPIHPQNVRQNYEYVILHAAADPNLGLYDGDKQWFRKTAPGVYESRNDNGYRLQDTDDGYAVTIPGGVQYRFDFGGALQRIVHPAGPAVTLTYTNGLLSRVAHSNGKALEFHYYGGLLASVTTPDTNVWMSYEYPAQPVYFLAGGTTVAGAGLLAASVRHTAQGDYRTTYAWDAGRNLVSRQNPNGDKFAYQYDNGMFAYTNTASSGGSLVSAMGVGGVGTMQAGNNVFIHPTPLKQNGRGCGMKVNGSCYQQKLSFANTNHTILTYRRDSTNLVSDYWFDTNMKRVTQIVGPGDRVETRRYDAVLNLTNLAVSSSTPGEVLTTSLRYGDGFPGERRTP